MKYNWLATAGLAVSVGVFAACGSPVNNNNSAPQTGGPAGSACDTAVHDEGCYQNGRMLCEPDPQGTTATAGKWSLVEACPTGQVCSEFQFDFSSAKVTAGCVDLSEEDPDGSVTEDGTTADGLADDALADATPDTAGTDAVTTGSDAVAATGYTWVVVDGSPYEEPNCSATTSAGADLDVVALYRGGKLVGVGKPGTAKEFKAAQPACPGKVRGTVDDVTGPLTTKMYTDATPDTGYFSLSNSRVYVQIGQCTQSTDNVKVCDGAGPVVTLKNNDEIDIYEIDSTYKVGGGTPASGIAPANCVCPAESYDVSVAMDEDSEPTWLGSYSGSKSAIKITID
jgi:hypothetical protein